MAGVSSVIMSAVVGAYINKGDEFGHFLFGGSDIILLFEPNKGITLNAAPMMHYNQGTCIGEDCLSKEQSLTELMKLPPPGEMSRTMKPQRFSKAL